ncbi:MAG: hypothetical protein ACYTG0_18145 [Planctomycetota bacterium]
MSPTQDDEKGNVVPPSDDDEYGLAAPAEPLKPAPPLVAPRPPIEQRGLADDDELPPPDPPKLPFWTGVLSFLWHYRTLPAWALVAIGLTISGLGVILCISLVDEGITLAAWSLAMPVFLVMVFCLSYTAACCTTIVEATASGYNQVVDWPSGLWRDWFWTLAPIVALLGLAATIGGVVAKVGGFDARASWIAVVAGVTLFFPVFLVSVLQSASPFALLSWDLFRSFRSVWWAWLLFYAWTASMIALWYFPTVAAFPKHPFSTPLAAGPGLAALIFIYARLIGRLAWSIDEYGEGQSES